MDKEIIKDKRALDLAYRLKENEVEEMRQKVKVLREKTLITIEENEKLEANAKRFYSNEKEIYDLKLKIKTLKDEKDEISSTIAAQRFHYERKLQEQEKAHAKETTELQTMVENYEKRINIYKFYDKHLEEMKKKIEELKESTSRKEEEFKTKLVSFRYENQSKNEVYVEKMKQKFESIADQMEGLYAKFFDEASQILALENAQLIIDLEMQATHIKSLSDITDKQKNMINQLKREKEVNKDLRLLLLEKLGKSNAKKTEDDQEIFKNSCVNDNGQIRKFEQKCSKLEKKLEVEKENSTYFKRKFNNLEMKFKEFEHKFEFLFRVLDTYLEIAENEDGRPVFVLNKEDFCVFDKLEKEKINEFVKRLVFFMIPLISKSTIESSFFESVVVKMQNIRGNMSVKAIKGRKLMTNLNDMLFDIKKHGRSASQSILPRI